MLLVAELVGCAKKEAATPLVLEAQINGQAWKADPASSIYTEVTDSYAYNPVRSIFSVEGSSPAGMPSLNLSRLRLPNILLVPTENRTSPH